MWLQLLLLIFARRRSYSTQLLALRTASFFLNISTLHFLSSARLGLIPMQYTYDFPSRTLKIAHTSIGNSLDNKMESALSAQIIKDAFAGKSTSVLSTTSQEPNPKRKAAEFLGLNRDETGERLPKKVKPLDKIWSAREKKGGESTRSKNMIDLLSPPFVPRSPVKTPSSARPSGNEKHNGGAVDSVTRIVS